MKLTVPIKAKGVLYKVGDDVPEKVFKLYPSLKKFKDGTNKGTKGSVAKKGSSSKSGGSSSSTDKNRNSSTSSEGDPESS